MKFLKAEQHTKKLYMRKMLILCGGPMSHKSATQHTCAVLQTVNFWQK